jgi:hypothetical protein
MQLQRLTPDLAVSQQLQPDDMPALEQAGIRSIIYNRPDGEGPDQPSFSQIQQEADRVGRALPACGTGSELPPGWDELPTSRSAQTLGREWTERGDALAMRVPSAVLPEGGKWS